jgi:hypothetical protein
MNYFKLISRILYTLFALITLYLFVYIHQQVPEPYMDEYFHFHQVANYCEGNYRHVREFEKHTTNGILFFFFFFIEVGSKYNHTTWFIFDDTFIRNDIK